MLARALLAVSAIGVASPAFGTEYVQVLNVAACPSVSGVPGDNLYTLSNWVGGNGIGAEWDSTDTVVLFCDLHLPAEATSFDGIELEYIWQSYAGNPGPSIATYLEQRAVGVDGTPYNATFELGECFGDFQLSGTYQGNCGLCEVPASVSFLEPDGGPVSTVPPTVYALIFLPPLNDYSMDQVTRLLVHYEAP